MSDFVKPPGGISSKQSKISFLPTEKKYILMTGENGDIKGYFPLKSKSLGTGWVAVYQDMISNIADEKLTYEEYRVFLKLLGKMDFDNYLTISQKELSQELDMKQPNISRAIRALCERKIIIEGPRAGLSKTYRFNPFVAHKGSERNNTIADFNSFFEDKEES